jgi:hypothetical protein
LNDDETDTDQGMKSEDNIVDFNALSKVIGILFDGLIIVERYCVDGIEEEAG